MVTMSGVLAWIVLLFMTAMLLSILLGMGIGIPSVVAD